ncbi:MAG: FtsW/RodA/SpoVE family cell cycle protein [Endomicrobiaceae bacterium]|jgi:cell division protein FtsW|nr:FtsW/RodA/SpoVE family cell cycle protein [Endomicrobiaceae bacterium]MDD4166691.1 FtsW/RodA/SpoVE family cell cycle protein [Endomicrobiaceae bacterium]
MNNFFKIIKNYVRNPFSELSSLNRYDWSLLIVIFGLLFIGITESLSVTPVRLEDISLRLFFKHIATIFLGIICFIFTAFVFDYKLYKEKKITLCLFIVIILMLVAVLVLGKETKGATRWLDLGIIKMQPSELAKIVFVLIATKILSVKEKIEISRNKKFFITMGYFIIFAALIGLQKDFGTIAFLGVIYTVILLIHGFTWKRVLITDLIFVIFATPLVLKQSYRMVRINDYLPALLDWTKSSDNVRNAIIALGSGGFFGKGFGQSEMKLLHLPEAHTDFIFPIIGEEIGFLGVFGIIFAFAYIMLKAFKISEQCDDYFGKNLSFTIGIMFAVQAAINTGMSIGVLPAKGMPLPFISYGGSSMLYSLITIGILFNISRKKQR